MTNIMFMQLATIVFYFVLYFTFFLVWFETLRNLEVQ